MGEGRIWALARMGGLVVLTIALAAIAVWAVGPRPTLASDLSGAWMRITVAVAQNLQAWEGQHGLALEVLGIVAYIALVSSAACIAFFLANTWRAPVTPLQLLELAQPTRPLLRRLAQSAPGTYHHSLMVSHLAEQAADRIGADALLVRVGALYHDVGKVVQPGLFVENQALGMNDHDRLDPRTSAQIIIGHVKDGLDLARKYRLPREVRAFIAEHHGTSLVKPCYHQALEQADDPAHVNAADFRYPGPRPGSKETALVMLADGCEAAVRAENPTSLEELTQIVQSIMADRAFSGELDECDLTIREMNQVRDTFVKVLQAGLHTRIKYPKGEPGQTATPPASFFLLPTPSADKLLPTPSADKPQP